MCGNFFKSGIGKVLAEVAPIAAAFIPGVGPLASAALAAGTSALSSKLQGGSWGNALESGAISGLGAAAMPVLGNAFQSLAPETAASFGLTSQAPTVLDSSSWGGLAQSLGLGGADAGGSAAGSLQGGSSSGLTAGLTGINAGGQTGDGLTNLVTSGSDPAADMQTASPVGSQVMAQDTNGTTAGASPGIMGTLGNIASKVGNGIVNNPGSTLLGLGSLYSGITTAEARAKQQKQLQAQQAAQAADSAAQTAAWNQTLQTPPLQRTNNPNNANINYATYGQGPEQNFLTNNQTSLANNTAPNAAFASGGRVQHYDSGGQATPSQTDEQNDMVNRLLDASVSNNATGGKIKALRAKMKKYPRKRGKIRGPGGPTADKIPAMLSDGEFVIKAKSVSALGGGNNNKGAKVLDAVNNAPIHKLHALGKKAHALKKKGKL